MTDPHRSSPPADELTLDQQISILSGADFWHTQAVPDTGVRSMMMADGPHGIRRQVGESDHLGLNPAAPATCFPTAVTLASSWDEELMREVGQAIAREAVALDVDVVLGPGLNIKRHPLGGRNFEYLSEDPLLTGRLATAMVEGIQGEGVGASPKHFAVNNQEGHRFVVDVVVDERTLREIYLSGFEQVVTRARPWTVMAAYNSVGGTTMTLHRELLTTVLREEWGFDGLVVSDWTATGERVASIEAGMDLAMPGGSGIDDAVLRSAVDEGRLSPSTVAASAQRVLDLQARCDEGRSTHTPGGGLPAELMESHDVLARRAAVQGSVLLTNDGLLPLAADTSVALIGPFGDNPRYQGAGSSKVNPLRTTSVRDALGERGARFTWDDGSDPDVAARRAATADVAVLMVGLPADHESEGFDREQLGLPREHLELIQVVTAAQPRTVVVLSNGSPVATPWRERPAAILEAYLGGQSSGGAVVDVLFGEAEPGGRLAESFPESLADVPADRWFPGDPRQVEYREGLFVGYRHHVTSGVPAAFPFGHGLGYTTFAVSDAALDRDRILAGEGVEVTATVTNTGERRGSEIVQVYRRDRSGVVLRPERELVGFARVTLDPGQVRQITVPVPARGFAFWDTGSGAWQVPEGPMSLDVARSSVDVLATLDLHVEGGVTSSRSLAGAPSLAVDDADFAGRLGHAVPQPRPVRPFTRDSTFGEIRTTPLGAVLRRLVLRSSGLGGDLGDADPAMRRMAERSFDELPLRAAAHFAAGKVPWAAVDALIRVLNLQPGGRR